MIRLATAATTLAFLAGCASFSADGGFDSVERLTRERTGQTPVWQRSDSPADTVQTRTAELLSKPLTADNAVERAMLSNRGLQASFQQLGIAESELVRAGRLSDPSFSFARLSGGGHVEIERAVGFNVLGLLTMPLATRVEERRFERVRLQAAAEAVGVAADTRRAYFEAVAAQELVTYFQQVKEAADASRELASRMAAAGNFSKLAHLRQQAFYADATSNLARTQHQAFGTREQLTRRLGLLGVFPAIDHLVARSGERVRVRVGNLTMTSHPIHLHGHDFEVTGTDGGWVPKAARWPEVSIDVAVGQMRAFEFKATAGDWALHCHKSHHTMNAMGHEVPTMIGVDHRGVAEKITRLVPDYMVMGERGMADMGSMEMPLPDNTLPMMSGAGPFGAMQMGGMFTVVKIRDEQESGDYTD